MHVTMCERVQVTMRVRLINYAWFYVRTPPSERKGDPHWLPCAAEGQANAHPRPPPPTPEQVPDARTPSPYQARQPVRQAPSFLICTNFRHPACPGRYITQLTPHFRATSKQATFGVPFVLDGGLMFVTGPALKSQSAFLCLSLVSHSYTTPLLHIIQA